MNVFSKDVDMINLSNRLCSEFELVTKADLDTLRMIGGPQLLEEYRCERDMALVFKYEADGNISYQSLCFSIAGNEQFAYRTHVKRTIHERLAYSVMNELKSMNACKIAA